MLAVLLKIPRGHGNGLALLFGFRFVFPLVVQNRRRPYCPPRHAVGGWNHVIVHSQGMTLGAAGQNLAQNISKPWKNDLSVVSSVYHCYT